MTGPITREIFCELLDALDEIPLDMTDELVREEFIVDDTCEREDVDDVRKLDDVLLLLATDDNELDFCALVVAVDDELAAAH